MELAKLRKEMDGTDWQILKLLARRLKLAKNIGEYKEKNKLPILDAQREKELILERKEKGNRLRLRNKFIDDFFNLILKESRRIQGDPNVDRD